MQGISLTLPALAAGEALPASCPHCGAGPLHDDLWAVSYVCRAAYTVTLSGGPLGPGAPCPRPTPAAVLRAVLAGLTPEQRERVAVSIIWTPDTVDDCIAAAADALETPDAR